MSIGFRPINNSDKKRMAPSEHSIIKSSPKTSLDKANSLPNNVVSSSIFGRADHSNDPDFIHKVYEDKYTRVGYIELAKPVLNPFLAGRSAPVWCSILNRKENSVLPIINGDTLFDLHNNCEVKLADIGTTQFDASRYLFGTEYLIKLLDEVDLEERLNKVLYQSFIRPVLSKSEITRYEEGSLYIGEIKRFPVQDTVKAWEGEIAGWFYGNFYLDMSGVTIAERHANETNAEFIARNQDRIEQIMEDLYDNIQSIDVVELRQFPIIPLITMMLDGEGKDILKSQILEYVFVLPYGYRPTIENRVDALTSQYNKLASANLELRDILNQYNQSTYTVLNKYKEVVQLVRNIFIGDDQVIQMQRLKDYKSLSDTITGKEGLMRGRMQGARVDNSGRAVITCDPDMPIDTIGVPRKMLYKIAEPAVIKGLRNHQPENGQKINFKNKNLATFSTTSSKDRHGITYEEYLDKWFAEEDRYGIPGRQPTLFYLGMQAFKIKPVDGDAIVLSPLVVMPFNADFDGDQMHFNMPITEKATKEVKERMNFVNNIRYPKNGEITVVTRHEIIYGLWICSVKKTGDNPKTVDSSYLKVIGEKIGCPTNHGLRRIVYDAVCKQELNVYDIVNIDGNSTTAGIIALDYAMFSSITTNKLRDTLASAKNGAITTSLITKLLTEEYPNNNTAFLNAINKIVKLGFSVARIWPPNISTIVPKEIEDYIKEQVRIFNEEIIEREELYNIGLEIEQEYTTYFNNKWDVLQKNITDYLIKNLDDDNGYVSMYMSGGKGNKSNIQQIFGIKGRVQKNDITSFNSIISGNYAGQLTGLEHFVTAYGSRRGIADKVLATAEPGYLSRKLEHAGCITSITAEDCGTDRGIDFSLEDIVPFIEQSQISKYGTKPTDNDTIFYKRSETRTQLLAAREYLSRIIKGRYCVDSDGNSVYIDKDSDAQWFINKHWGYYDSQSNEYKAPVGDGVVTMRSPLYCTKPCCKKCYGKDIAAGKPLPEMGRPIGFIAAQAIGEPGTQMTMKNFQKGGVVSDANLTSSFELIEDYFELHDFSKKKRSKKGVYSYDIISPVTGYVKEQYLGNNSKRILVTATNDPNDRKNLIPGTSKLIVHANTKLKKSVKRGDSFQEIQGNLNMKEVLKYRGFDKAVSYLCLNLHNIFDTQDVDFKHFETIVAGMTCALIVADTVSTPGHKSIPYGKDSVFRAGSIMTRPEVYYGSGGETPTLPLWTIIGLTKLPKFKSDFLESLLMERMDSHIPRAILMNPSDSMTNPITLTSFGLPIGVGSDLSE